MSIPERFFRIAKSKLSSTASEIRERIDRWDDERNSDARGSTGTGSSQADAQQELLDSLKNGSPTTAPARPRTPAEIANGSAYVKPTVTAPAAARVEESAAPDPLAFHYRILGVQAGDDFTVVQAAYSRLFARSEPSRFPAGSDEERQAKEIQSKLETSYKILREAIDPTSRRFDLLEFDDASPGSA